MWPFGCYPLYCITRGYKGYASPFLSLRHEVAVSLGYAQTKDGVSLWDMSLDVTALDSMIQEA